ncbi:hypothetical protein NUW58_g7089 [Xylaria curta]|uniref:Uncharacterized protein n=1 Tax=Xylaria curta TaxID=42375 RepID=A0ACC1NLT8_9PEZI|nr:hypothetical protein NUW58_g7089 [Xylaria curta]
MNQQIEIPTEIRGNRGGGSSFKAMKPLDADYLASLQIWTHFPFRSSKVLRGIKLLWNSGETQSYGTTAGNPQDEAKFIKNELITEMVIWAGDWVDAISYKSTYLPQGRKLGGPGGTAYAQNHGNGLFLGFHGRSGASIDALGSIFEIRRHLVSSALQPANNRGGTEFVAQAVDDRAYVSSIQVWVEPCGMAKVLRGIQMQWSNGQNYLYGNCRGLPYDEATFRAEERITEFAIWAGAWVDAISYKSTFVPDGKIMGGNGGNEYTQQVGDGIFVGLNGRCGDRIDALGAIFSLAEK